MLCPECGAVTTAPCHRPDCPLRECDPPIEEQDFRGGVTVVDIGDIRVARGFTRRHHGACQHRALVYDNRKRRIWCQDCRRDVEAFDAFEQLVGQYSAALDSLKRRDLALKEAEAFSMAVTNR